MERGAGTGDAKAAFPSHAPILPPTHAISIANVERGSK